ncbi:hypothetical protein [Levilactobacillus brevis]|uniref:hypothetical protein n=1 Tax=Levilactobacillus brevis TaxID=1580 RepID=UPI0035A30FDC
MNKEEIIQNLFDQIHSINDHYLAIIAIVLILTGIAFSALMWLQVRLSKTQYQKMKSELMSELVKKYDLDRMQSLSISADRHIKMTLGQITFQYASSNGKLSKSEQSQIANQLVYSEDSFRRDSLLEDKEDVGYMIWKTCNMLLTTKNLDENVEFTLKKLIDKTKEYQR